MILATCSSVAMIAWFVVREDCLLLLHAEHLIRLGAAMLMKLRVKTITLCHWMSSSEALKWFVLLMFFSLLCC